MTAAAAPAAGVAGGDATLADAVRDLVVGRDRPDAPGARVRFEPDATSDLARALGLGIGGGGLQEAVTLDVLRLDGDRVAVNMVVLGAAPDRRSTWRLRSCRVEVDGRVAWDGPASGVVVANGEYLRGLDVVPRGHPGDGRLEVHVYALDRAQRRQMRARLATGTHLPHPGIRTAQGTAVTIRWDRPVPLEVDGVGRGRAGEIAVTLVPEGLTLVP